MSTPNILFILSDQQRWDTVDCYGRPIFPGLTPNLDRMAGEGVMFRHAFTPQPVCGPARSCLQTGQYATETGFHTNHRGLRDGQRTLAHWMSESGYQVGYVGKWHLSMRWDETGNAGTQPIPVERRGGYSDYWLAAETLEYTSHGYEGFLYDINDQRVDFEGYRVDRTADFVIDALRDLNQRNHSRPFFLFASFIEPHHQNDLNRYIGPIGSKEKFRDYNIPGDLENAAGFWEKQLPDYLGCCESLDQNVGKILAELNSLGISDDTIVIYTSDHGDHFGTRNSESKRSPHEASIRVPLIIRGPGFEGGRIVDELVSLIDLPPTVLAAGDIEAPAQMRGHPLQKLLQEGPGDWPSDVFVQISESMVGRALRTDRWKYSIHAPDRDPVHDASSDRYEEYCLYDLQNDPHERNNLVDFKNHEDLRKELAERLKQRMKEAGESPCTIG
jgi:arylsulfatase A-like enzyme